METKELIPEYVLQPHAISRAIYRLSATARKLIAMGMAVIPPDLSSLKASFSVFEFCQALGLNPGGETYHIIQDGIKECVMSAITIETEEEWKTFTWVQTAKINKKTSMITLIFSDGLADYLVALKKMYARLDLMDLGKLQSLYAIHLFEMVKSYESLAGKNGNRENCWYFERKIDEIRKILGVEDRKYKATNDFKKRVIEGPIKELNNANLGLVIIVEYIKKGKYLVGIRFNCERNIRKVKGRKRKIAEALPAPDPDPRTADTLKAKEDEHLKKLYLEEYVQLYVDELNKPHPFLTQTSPLKQQAAETVAVMCLRERHGIRL